MQRMRQNQVSFRRFKHINIIHSCRQGHKPADLGSPHSVEKDLVQFPHFVRRTPMHHLLKLGPRNIGSLETKQLRWCGGNDLVQPKVQHRWTLGRPLRQFDSRSGAQYFCLAWYSTIPYYTMSCWFTISIEDVWRCWRRSAQNCHEIHTE